MTRRRLIGWLAAAVAAVVLGTALFSGHDTEPAPPETTGATAGYDGAQSGTEAAVTVTPRQAATDAATAYLRAFFNGSLPDRRWRRTIDHWSTRHLQHANRTFPRDVVPQGWLREVTITGMTDDYAKGYAALDGQVHGVTYALVLTGDRWRVDEVAPR